MDVTNTRYTITFENSKETTLTDLNTLMEASVEFLEHYGEVSLLGDALHTQIQAEGGQAKFLRLLKAAGYSNDPDGFFSALIPKLEAANGEQPFPLKINQIALPRLLLVAILEKIIPGNRLVSIKNVRHLEKLTNIAVPENDRRDIQNVIETYSVKLSTHTVRQMRISNAVRRQYMPFVEEMDPFGQPDTWTGLFRQGIIERMYQNRVAFLLNMTCPVYCRFCFRKHRTSRNQPKPTRSDVKRAIAYVEKSPLVKEVLITGGDPFLNKSNLIYAINGLMKIPHVQTLRLATRSIAYYPYLFLANDSAWLNRLKKTNLALQKRIKRLEIATHFVHPDEISPESLTIISSFVQNGIAVYVQTPLLKDCNDEGDALTKLFSQLRAAGAEMHFLDIPCSPIQGNMRYQTPVSKALQIAAYLRAHLSDRGIPKICTATSIGKMDWHTSGWAVEQDKDNPCDIWIRTPYSRTFYETFARLGDASDTFRVNAEGSLDTRYRAEIGDVTLFLGSRKPRSVKVPQDSSGLIRAPWRQVLAQFQTSACQDHPVPECLPATGSTTLFRVHKTRVEIDAEAHGSDLEYIRADRNITDIVVFSHKDVLGYLDHLAELIKKIQGNYHVNAIRLRSLTFNYAPEKYTRAVLNKLGNLNKPNIINPLRLEIETQFLHSSEFKPSHGKLAIALRNLGIFIYNNTPLLSPLNDTPDEIHEIAYQCRKIGIEFHHVYIAGWPLQKTWNEEHPIEISDMIDIASRVRRDGSGREVPKYIIRTKLGEVDFGLTSHLHKENEQIWVKLLPYTLTYYQNISPAFSWPADIKVDSDGRPIIRVPGIKSSDGFLVT